MTTCRELIEFLDQYIAGELPAEQRKTFEWHLHLCRSCHDYLRTYEETVKLEKIALKLDERPEIPDALVQAILAARKK